MIAETNSGTAVNERPVSVIARSANRPRLSAATTPPSRLSGTTRTIASAASSSELTSEACRRDQTGTLYSSDIPRSPRTKCQIQLPYWV